MDHLLLLLINILSSFLPAAAGPIPDTQDHRPDAWQPGKNNTFVCLFLTSGPQWTGEMQNLCDVGGQCGMSFSSTTSPTLIQR